jgi:hypothetical protein
VAIRLVAIVVVIHARTSAEKAVSIISGPMTLMSGNRSLSGSAASLGFSVVSEATSSPHHLAALRFELLPLRVPILPGPLADLFGSEHFRNPEPGKVAVRQHR